MKCWKCEGPITGAWRTLFPKPQQGTVSGRMSWRERVEARHLFRKGVVVCAHCYECFDANGNELPELERLAGSLNPPPPVLGVDLMPSGEEDDK